MPQSRTKHDIKSIQFIQFEKDINKDIMLS